MCILSPLSLPIYVCLSITLGHARVGPQPRLQGAPDGGGSRLPSPAAQGAGMVLSCVRAHMCRVSRSSPTVHTHTHGVVLCPGADVSCIAEFPSRSYTYAYSHAHAYTRIHTHTHAYTRIHAFTRIHAYTHTHPYPCMHTRWSLSPVALETTAGTSPRSFHSL